VYQKQSDPKSLLKLVNTLVVGVGVVLVLLGLTVGAMIIGPEKVSSYFKEETPKDSVVQVAINDYWVAPDSTTIPEGAAGDEIRYGRELIAHTSEYLGPKGKVMAVSNGMNCQNCHLKAGTKIFGNNYSAVASTYPKFRSRSGTSETIEKRVNDCVERSLNGKSLDNESREMRAIVSYIKWIGKDVPQGESPKGVGLMELPYLDIPADPIKGKLLYDEKCTVCHGNDGQGVAKADSTGWTYPPLWGSKSYNVGAGLYRLSRFAGYIKANMPWGATYNQPQLTDEECWHLAAYINSLKRPTMDLSKDWPDISKKPIDHPFGPFTDGFNEMQHKFGPFKPIADSRKKGGKSE
jgi:thiosulfate dehydrogenase